MSINWQDELALGSGEIFEPEPIEETSLEMDLRCPGSFAESQARIARALDHLTERVKGHLA